MEQTALRRPTVLTDSTLLPELGSGFLLTLLIAPVMALLLHLPLTYLAFVAFLYGLLASTVLVCWLRCTDGPLSRRFGWANRVTFFRATLITPVAALVLYPDTALQHGWGLAGLSLSILILDGVDGLVARQTGTVSRFGSRFDMEVDAFFILVLALLLATSQKVGGWVLCLGLARYCFMLAMLAWPWLGQPLPSSFRRKTVCVWQTATLLVCLTPAITPIWSSRFLFLAFVLLVCSFWADTAWLIERRKLKSSHPAQGGNHVL